MVHGILRGVPPAIELADERALQQLMALLAAESLIQSAHDCSDGGLAVTLAECAFDSNGIGCDVTLPPAAAGAGGTAAALFGEAASQIVVSVREADADRVAAVAAAAGVPACVLGRTGGARLRFAIEGGSAAPVDVPLAEAEQAWSNGLTRHFEETAA